MKKKNVIKLNQYLSNLGLIKEIEAIKKHIDSNKNNKVADLACGSGWFSSILSSFENIEEVHAVEISSHRLGKLFEKTVSLMNGNPKKIKRYLGSFYDLKFKDPMDIIFLCQSFHHAEKPFHLLNECKKNLKKGGKIILLGEQFISLGSIIRRFIKHILYKGKLTLDFFELFPPDDTLGDHYYRSSDYFLMASSNGLKMIKQKTSRKNRIYIMTKPL